MRAAYSLSSFRAIVEELVSVYLIEKVSEF